MKNNSTAGNGGKNTAKWNDRHTMPGEWTEKKNPRDSHEQRGCD